MQFKKIGVLLVAAAFAISAGAGTADAAKGGGKIAAPKVSAPKAAPAPKASTPSASEAKKDTPNTKEYAPSKKADQYKENAPAAKSAAANPASNAVASVQKSSGWGSALRTVGMLAGGMMLGSMLSHLFGFGGSGLLADIMGLLVNLAMAAVVVYLVKMLVGWFMKKKQNNNADSAYNRESASVRDRYVQDTQPVQDIRPPKTIDAEPIQDIKPPSAKSKEQTISAASVGGWDYDSSTAAEKYRKM